MTKPAFPSLPGGPAHAFARRVLPFAVAACFALPAAANPGGASVAAGAASFSVDGKTLTVTNTPGTIINWQQFSIRPDEITRFVQSGAASAVLNRVTGGDPSQILGQLLSNGRVFLINPAGVSIGAGAVIDTAGFVASSLNIGDADFLSGRMRFSALGGAGKVENHGTIRSSAGPVYLIAPTVENHGVIRAENGDILLAAGKRVELVAGASPHLRVELDNADGATALNVGQLVGRSVNLYGTALRNAGSIQATRVEVGEGGGIFLRAAKDVTLEAGSRMTASGDRGGTVAIEAGATLVADGVIEARGATGRGGDVRLLGERVGLVGNAAVDASGAAGGGTILTGGDYQGANPEVRNAVRTYVGRDATLRADATDRGDGGRIIIWADELTRFEGSLAARGGPQGGNGGFAEISGKDSLVHRGRVDLDAPRGAAGTLLLDPLAILIRGGTADGSDTPDAANNVLNQSAVGQVLFGDAGTTDPFVVYESELEAATTNIILQARNGITVDSSVAFGGGAVLLPNNRNLTLQTRNLAGDGAAGIDLTAGGALPGLLFRTQGTGTLTIQSGFGPGAVAAPVTVGALQTANQAVNILATGNVTLANNVNAGTGAVVVRSTTGSIARTGGTVTGGSVTLDGATGVGTALARVFTSATTLAARTTASGDVFVNEANAVTLNAIGGTPNGTAANGSYDLQAGGNITVSGAIGTNGSGNTTLATVGAGNIAIGANVGATTNTTTRLTAVGSITRTAGTVSGQDVILDAGTNVGANATANRIFTDATRLAARSRNANGSVFVTEANAVTLDTIAGVGNGTANGGNGGYTLGAAGTITVQGGITTGSNTVGAGNRATGAIALTATAGSIVLNGDLATGNAASDDAAANTAVTSGGITLSAAAGGISGNGALLTGNAELRGAAAAGTDAATSGSITITAGAGGIDRGGATTTGTASRTGGGVNTDTTTSGSITLNAPGGTGGAVAVNAALTSGDVSGGGLGTSGSGNIQVTSGGGAVTLNAPLATGSASGADTAATNQTVRSGNVTVSAGTSVAGTAGIATGVATLLGAAATGTDAVSSGTIVITAGTGGASGGIGLAGTLATGNATRSGATQDTATSGGITLTSRDEVNNGTAATPLAVLIGTPSGGAANNRGALRSITSQAGGNIYVTSAGVLNVGDTDTAAGSAQTVSMATTGGNALTVLNNAETLTGDTLLLNAGTGVLTILDNAYDVAAGSLTLTADEINLTGGASSIRGTGAVTLQPFTAAQGVNVGGADSGLAGRLDLVAADILALQNGFANIVIGAAAGSGQIDVRANTFNDNLTLRTPGAGSAGVTFTGAVAAGTNSVTVQTTGTATQTAAIVAGTLALAGGGSYTLTNAGNNVATLTANAASVDYLDSNALNVGPLTATGSVLVRTATGAGNDITLANNVTSSGGNVTLASGEDIHYGAFAPSAPAGRWLTYSRSPAQNTGTIPTPGNAKPNLYNSTFAVLGPGVVLPASGNHNVYSYQPTLSYTATLTSRPYGAANPALTGAITGLVNGDTAADAYSGTATWSTPATALSGVGAYSITGAGLTSDVGYAFAQAPANSTAFTITPAGLTITANDRTKTYGQTVTFTGTEFAASGLQNGETVGSVTLASIGGAPTAGVTGSPYAINASGAAGGTFDPANYAIAYVPGTLTVSPAALAIVANNQTKVYGDTLTFAGTEFAASGLQNGETVGSVVLASAGAAPTATVPGGPYAINASGASGGTFTASNYTVIYTDGMLTVTPRPLTVAADNQTKVYGRPDPALTYSAPGLVNGDALAGALSRVPGETVPGSPYAIHQGTVTDANNPNYAISFTAGSLSITPAPLGIAANSAARLYGDANPALTATFTGLVNGDTPSSIPGLSITTPATLASNVGAYAITPAGGVNPNYFITYADGTLTILPAPLTVTADDALRFFGQPNPPFSATYTGFRLGQGPGDLAGTLALATLAVPQSPPGAYPIVPSGLSSLNYAVTFVDGTLSIASAAPANAEEARDVAVQRAVTVPAMPRQDGGCATERDDRPMIELARGLCIERTGR